MYLNVKILNAHVNAQTQNSVLIQSDNISHSQYKIKYFNIVL